MKKSKVYILILSGLLIFFVGITASINDKKSNSECEKIINKIESESFKGVIIRKTRPDHFNRIFVDTNIGIIEIIRTYSKLEYDSNIGDSIIKSKNVNLVKIKHKNTSTWIEYKYKTIPRSCKDYSAE